MPFDPIGELLARFDFASLRRALRDCGRRWREGQGPYRVPTEEELRACARALLERLDASEGTVCMRAGGFVARHCGQFWTLTYEHQLVIWEQPPFELMDSREKLLSALQD